MRLSNWTDQGLAMTEEEANAILASVKTTEHQATKKRLASGDMVVVMADGVFIWTKAEWKQYRKGTLPALHIESD